jgi:hypothetical protein
LQALKNERERKDWMSDEFADAIDLANRVLDKPWIDPDGDICLLARQFLRLVDGLVPLAEFSQAVDSRDVKERRDE